MGEFKTALDGLNQRILQTSSGSQLMNFWQLIRESISPSKKESRGKSLD